MRRLLVAAGVVLLAACAGKPVRAPVADPADRPAATPAASASGGLYAPHIRDSGPEVPPDVSGLPEPVPRSEPLARYGNRPTYSVLGRSYRVMTDPRGYRERGTASWYGTKFHGRPTSSFEPYDMYQFTAAHKTLPLPTFVRVTHLGNGRSIVVRVNDRGPFHGDRIIDLSYAAAVKLGMHIKGTAEVEVVALEEGLPQSVTAAAGSAVAPAIAASGEPVYLQVGSFGERANADRAMERLRGSGVDGVEVRSVRLGGRRVHRVRIGPLLAERVADVAGRLRDLGFANPQVVRD